MIEHARRNAPGAKFVVADAGDFELDEPVAMVVSTFDSLNHVMSLERLEQVFASVAAVLRPGGRFVFDLNVDSGYRDRWRGTFAMDEPGELIVAESAYHPDERVGTMRFTWFVESQDRWTRRGVTLTQRCYEVAEVVAALDRCGFEGMTASDAADLTAGWQAGRVFFSALKRAGHR